MPEPQLLKKKASTRGRSKRYESGPKVRAAASSLMESTIVIDSIGKSSRRKRKENSDEFKKIKENLNWLIGALNSSAEKAYDPYYDLHNIDQAAQYVWLACDEYLQKVELELEK